MASEFSEYLDHVATARSEYGRYINAFAVRGWVEQLPSPGLERGKAALKLIIRNAQELDDTVRYIRAMTVAGPLLEERAQHETNKAVPVVVDASRVLGQHRLPISVGGGTADGAGRWGCGAGARSTSGTARCGAWLDEGPIPTPRNK